LTNATIIRTIKSVQQAGNNTITTEAMHGMYSARPATYRSAWKIKPYNSKTNSNLLTNMTAIFS